MVRLRTWDRGVQAQIPPGPSDFSEQKIRLTFCSSSSRCINGYPDRVVFAQGCYSLSTISRCSLLEKGREIVSLGRLDCRFHKVKPMIRGSCVKGWLNG